jgi:hypothetical protein
MIDLREHEQPILSFLQQSLTTFREANPDVRVGHTGLYCCPWSGWVSLCINPTAEAEPNCPDFEFVEVALYEAPAWASEYEEAEPLVVTTLAGIPLEVAVEVEGDEALNRIFYEFLRQLLRGAQAVEALRKVVAGPTRVGVQLLDSEFNESWELRAV